MKTPLVINGRTYPLWQQFVDRKAEFIGRTLQDFDMGQSATTEITDIVLRENGADSAFFEVVGKDFTCGFDVRYGGVVGGNPGYFTLNGYGGHQFRIKDSDAPKEPVYFIDEDEAGFGFMAHDRKAAHQWLDALLDQLEDGEAAQRVDFKRKDMTKAEIDALPEV